MVSTWDEVSAVVDLAEARDAHGHWSVGTSEAASAKAHATASEHARGWIKTGDPGEDTGQRAANAARAKTGALKRPTRQQGSIGGGFAVAGGSSDLHRPLADALTKAAQTGKDHYIIPTAIGYQASSSKALTTSMNGYIHVKPDGTVTKMERSSFDKPHAAVARMSDHSVSAVLDDQLSKTKKAAPPAPAAKAAAKPAARTTASRKDIARAVKDMQRNPSLLTPALKARLTEIAANSGSSDLIPQDWSVSWDDLAAVIDLAAGKLATTALVTRESGKAHHRNPATVGRSARTDLPPAGAPRLKTPRPRLTPLTPMRHQAAKSLRRLAASVESTHPEMIVHQHLRDAARVLESGNEEGAQRHLRAAIGSVTPQALYRHGISTDDGHIQGKQAMAGIHRHLLLIKDIEDVGAKNRAALARHAGEADAASPSLPAPPARPDPNAGYGPGALAQKPTARQPGGDRAMNAPDRTNSGGSDPAVADPAGTPPKGGKQFARTWSELADAIELSAETGTLATTPHPFGKPGGPGLWGVKHMELPPYVQNIAHALLRTGRAKTLGEAIAMAKAATARWARGKNTTPEVRAASAATDADWEAKRARAHAHAVTWDDHANVIALAAAAQQPASKSQAAQAQARVPKGQPGGGEFAPGQTSAAPTDARPVGAGASGKPVSDLQARLNALGTKPPLKADGTFGAATLAAVKAFQKAHGLKVDGLVGPLTTAALRGKPPAKAPAKKK